MKLIIAGIGPGNLELITLSALNEAKNSDFILVPRSHEKKNRRCRKNNNSTFTR